MIAGRLSPRTFVPILEDGLMLSSPLRQRHRTDPIPSVRINRGTVSLQAQSLTASCKLERRCRFARKKSGIIFSLHHMVHNALDAVTGPS